jgi:hypothetical protein
MTRPHHQQQANMDQFTLFSRVDSTIQSSLTQNTLAGDESSHQGLLRVLAIATALRVNILPLTWQPALEELGEGGMGLVNQSSLNADISFAYKRFNPKNDRFRDLQYEAMISEIVALSCPGISRHPNITALEGLCWEVQRSSGEVLPVLVLQKAECGDLRRFSTMPDAATLGINARMAYCGEMAKALKILHQRGETAKYHQIRLLVLKVHRRSSWRHQARKYSCR